MMAASFSFDISSRSSRFDSKRAFVLYGQGQAYRSTFGGAPVYTREKFIKELVAALGVEREEDLLHATVTVGAKFNNRHGCIKPVQKWLAALGYEEVGQADGCAGNMFTSALAHFQQDRGCAATGIAEEWGRTWQELMGTEVNNDG